MGVKMRWPWRRQRQLVGESRPAIEFIPEPPSELRALVEAHAFGHVDHASDWLETFLRCPELDDLGTRHIASDLTPEQERRVREIVTAGEPRQALFNLLMWPQLIPADVRLATACAAMRQERDPYMRIAAAVGLQERKIADADWPAVRDALLGLLRDPRQQIQNRATIALRSGLRAGDAGAVVAAVLSSSLGPGEIESFVGALLKVGASDAALHLLPRLLESDRLHPDVRAWLETWQSTGTRPDGSPPRDFGLSGLAYIPNLDE